MYGPICRLPERREGREAVAPASKGWSMATHFLGFLTLAAALTGYKKLAKAKSVT
jgi:hypothetical protein